jgi:rod shape-determining protein MreD
VIGMERAANIMAGRFVSSIVPVAFGILGVVIANFPISILGGLVPPALLVFMPLYFWAMVRPDLMTPFWAFYFLIDRQRDMLAGLSGIGAVAGFAVASLTACLSAYLIVAIYYWHLPPAAPMLLQLAMTVLFYIPGVILLGFVHRRLVGPYRSDF